MRHASLVVSVLASALVASPSRAARLAIIGAVTLGLPGCGCTSLQITTSNPLPEARVGQAYMLQLEASGDCASEAEWSPLDGDLPPGLTLSLQGVLEGVPSQAGIYTFSVWASALDFSSTPASGDEDSRTFLLIVAAS